MNGVATGESGRKKRSHRGGKNRKRPKAAPTEELAPEQSADSMSSAEAGSESSVHGYYAAIEKVTGKLKQKFSKENMADVSQMTAASRMAKTQ